MKLDITVPEVVELFKSIKDNPEALFEMMRLDIQQIAGGLSKFCSGKRKGYFS